MFDEPAAEVVVVLSDAVIDIPQGQLITAQLVGIDDHVVLTCESSPTVDLANPWDGPQLVLDLPFVEGLQVHRTVALTLDGVLVDLAKGGRHRTESRVQTRRDAGSRFCQVAR